jgi:DNA-binding NarL/FixJ family response regulator
MLPLTKEEIMQRPLPMKLVERLAREMEFPSKLSDREIDVLALVACGCTWQEIGVTLHLSHWTIQTHYKRIRMKLGARNMAHAVALALVHHDLDASLVE